MFKKQKEAEGKKEYPRVSKNLDANLKIFKGQLNNCSDVIFKPLIISDKQAYLLYCEGLIDTKVLNENILQVCFADCELKKGELLTRLKYRCLAVGDVSCTSQVKECIESVLSGQALLLLEGYDEILKLEIRGWDKRSIEAPTTSPSVKGPQESFIETLQVNVALLRRRFITSDLKILNFTLGERAPTYIKICYLESLANPKLIEEVVRRIKSVNIDALLDVSYLEELIEDEPYSLFRTVKTVERPDTAAASLLEGRVVILQDNTPFALIAPTTFHQFLQSVGDYYDRYYFGTLIRYLRYAALFLALYLPSIYVAVTTFHMEMLPTSFMISLQAQREGVPFPALLEAIVMGFAFEVLREAGLRLPRAVGQAVSIVGALIIGDAAVTAGLASPAMIIVTALTAISAFTFPVLGLNEPITILRFLLVLASGFAGLWGILIFTLFLIGHLASLRSFGIPYLNPLAPFVIEDLDDMLVRAPLWQNKKRPLLLAKRNLVRIGKRYSPYKR